MNHDSVVVENRTVQSAGAFAAKKHYFRGIAIMQNSRNSGTLAVF